MPLPVLTQEALPFAPPPRLCDPDTLTPPAVTVLSCGLGQDSVALLYKLVHDESFRLRYAPGRLLIVFSDTGDEHSDTYAYLTHLKRFCADRRLEFVHLTPEMGFHHPSWLSLRHFYRTHNTIGSKAFPKTCSQQLKIDPIHRFLESWLHREYGVIHRKKQGFVDFARQHGKLWMLVGIAAGEDRRVADPASFPVWKQRSMVMHYPLIDLGWDRLACQAYIRNLGYEVPPSSCCVLCHFASKQELLWLSRRHPADLTEWISLEAKKIAAHQDKGTRNLGVFGSKLLPQILDEATRQYGSLTDDELDAYRFSHGHQVGTQY